jgi:hypothetical protein
LLSSVDAIAIHTLGYVAFLVVLLAGHNMHGVKVDLATLDMA